VDITMHNEETLNVRPDPGVSMIERESGMGCVGVVCIPHERLPNRKFVLKVLKRQLSSDLEYLTIQMRSTQRRSDEPSQDCQYALSLI
jgi:7,8-dihydro-6-hydroxymethylpterin-pyrophosphokinase